MSGLSSKVRCDGDEPVLGLAEDVRKFLEGGIPLGMGLNDEINLVMMLSLFLGSLLAKGSESSVDGVGV